MNEKLNEALEQIRDEYVEEAAKPRKKRSFYWLGAVAAILVVAILAGILGNFPRLPNEPAPPVLQKPTDSSTRPPKPGATDPNVPSNPQITDPPPLESPPEPPTSPDIQEPHDPTDPAAPTDPESPEPPMDPTDPVGGTPPAFDPGNPSIGLLAAPHYPKMEKYPQGDNGSYSAWWESQKEQYDQPRGYADSLDRFFADSIRLFLQGEGNQAYSPVNVYMAMAMLAECTDGSSRQQILDLFGADSIESLRQQASYVWNAHYCDDGLTTLLMANSLWLDDAYTFRQVTVDRLASDYYASTYHGDLGTEEMNQCLRQWLNANTGDLLTEQSQNTKLEPDTVLALASTIYFSAQWEERFWDENTKNATFRSPAGDQIVPFMNRTFGGRQYFWGDNFGAMSLDMCGNNKMWLILPDEGSTTDDLLESGDFVTMLQNPSAWNDTGLYDVHLSLPKFDVADQTDLVEGMQKLGITEACDPKKADFSALVTNSDAYVDKIDHAVRVAVNENGCTAAAYTVILVPPGSAPPKELEEIPFTLDRPFIFVITSRDGLPLFAGTVAEP